MEVNLDKETDPREALDDQSKWTRMQYLNEYLCHSHMLGQHLLVSSLDGFMCSRVGECGFEMLGKRNRDERSTETQGSAMRATQGILNPLAFIFHILISSNSKSGEEGKKLL